MQRASSSRASFAVALAVAAAVLPNAGCGRYLVGNGNLFPHDIRTVYVPVIESDSYRRNLGERLTEAVIKRIEDTTPYKVVSTPAADSVLTCRIVGEPWKRLLVETPTDEGRELQINFRVEATWVDRRGVALQAVESVPLPPSLTSIEQSTTFLPEVGQSISTAQQDAIQKLANQIVALMENPW